MGDRLIIAGKDNYGKSRQGFADTLAGFDDVSFIAFAENKVWLSAYADNNRRSDYHWQADACYDEAGRRGKPELYERAWQQASGAVRAD
jgi:hypothetical protein